MTYERPFWELSLLPCPECGNRAVRRSEPYRRYGCLLGCLDAYDAEEEDDEDRDWDELSADWWNDLVVEVGGSAVEAFHGTKLSERQYRGFLEFLRHRTPSAVSLLCLGPHLWSSALCSDGRPFEVERSLWNET